MSGKNHSALFPLNLISKYLIQLELSEHFIKAGEEKDASVS